MCLLNYILNSWIWKDVKKHRVRRSLRHRRRCPENVDSVDFVTNDISNRFEALYSWMIVWGLLETGWSLIMLISGKQSHHLENFLNGIYKDDKNLTKIVLWRSLTSFMLGFSGKSVSLRCFFLWLHDNYMWLTLVEMFYFCNTMARP